MIGIAAKVEQEIILDISRCLESAFFASLRIVNTVFASEKRFGRKGLRKCRVIEEIDNTKDLAALIY